MSISSRATIARAMDHVRGDVRFACRQLLNAPSFTVAAIATLAIGIGATAAVFSLLNAVVLRPLPFAEPGRVVNLLPARDGISVGTASGLEFSNWRALTRVFSATAAYIPQTAVVLDRGHGPRVVSGTSASAAALRVIGVQPEIGRDFVDADDGPGGAKVVLISHRLWREEFQSDPSVVGRTIHLDNAPYTVVGVLPLAADILDNGDDVWIPLALSSEALLDFKARNLRVVARLAPGVTLPQAVSAVDGAEQRLAAESPIWGKGFTGQVHLFADDLVGNLRPRLFVLLGAVALVFLIACVNVTNLLLARGTTRRTEMAIRTALGAERGRLVGQLLAESMVLCLSSGAAGIVLAFGLIKSVVAASPPGVPRMADVGIDAGAIVFTLGVSVICALLVGVLPAWRATTLTLQATLREGSRGSGENSGAERGRNLLVVTEVALAMTLLTGAALLIRSALAISAVNPGFRSDHIFTAQILLPGERYNEPAVGLQAFRAIRDGVAQVPGVVSVALTSSLPLSGSVRAGIGTEQQPLTDGQRFVANLRLITPGYFTTMGMRLRAGRDFLSSDDGSHQNVAIINAALAARFWPGQSALGKRFEGMSPDHQHFMTVVGIVADIRDVGLDQAPTPEFYIPIEQMPAPLWNAVRGSLTVAARTGAAPETVERPIRAAVSNIDPSLPLASVATMESITRSSRATARFNTLLLVTLGAVAFLLAAVGIYGVVAYFVSQRSREVALRMALGATPGIIALFVLRRALVPVVIGVGAGAVLSTFATRLLREQLYGVVPGDPSTILGIAAVLVLSSCLAAGIPTRRAMGTPPAVVLAA